MTRQILTRLAVAALLLGASACSSPEDETWIRVTSFSQEGKEVSVINSSLQEDSEDVADVMVGNFSTGAQGQSTGIGVTIERATVSYSFRDFVLPIFDYAVRAYLPAPGSSSSDSEGALESLPMVPLMLKKWLLDPGNVPSDITCCPFSMEAQVTIRGVTDDGRPLSTDAAVTVMFN